MAIAKQIKKKMKDFDQRLLPWVKKISPVLGRGSLSLVFFWFGILKIFGASSAEPLLRELWLTILPGVSFSLFLIFLGSLEVLIALLFLVPGFERLAVPVLLAHMLATFLPLVLLPARTWQGLFMPTLEGQYIIKNVLIVALAFFLAAHLSPLKNTS